MPNPSRILAFAAPLALAALAQADLRLPSVFADHMVLQRDSLAPVWGTAEPGERVVVTASWRAAPYFTAADDAGRWFVEVHTPAAGGPYELSVEAGEERVAIEDVLSGEVWVCSGQSNMAWTLGPVGGRPGVDDWEAEAAAADHPDIRLFQVRRATSMTPEEHCDGEWIVCGPETVEPFSAVAYFYARELQRELRVPVGLLSTSWGGTLCEAWTSAEAFEDFDEFDPFFERLEEVLADVDGAESGIQSRLAEWWRAIDDEDPEAHLPQFDDRSWRTMELPCFWRDVGLGGFDGVVWFRRAVELPEDWAGRPLELELGPIDDLDSAWFNGRKVGSVEEMGRWQEPRRYRVRRGAVRPGRNVIAVRVVDTGGLGGINGIPDQLRLRPVKDPEAVLSLAGEWRYRRGASMSELGPLPSGRWFTEDSPTALFNAMIAPLVPYGIRGAIWYQGESNRERAAQYRRLFPNMIADWRSHWDRGAFPFYFVQIAPYRYGGDQGEAAELREAQMLALATPNTGMAVTMDIGNPGNIHPSNKQDVGRRLALWALARTYGREDLVCSGPLYRSMKVEGDAIRLAFDHAGSGLVARDGAPTHFAIAGADRVFHPAEAGIEGDTVVVRSTAVAEPVAVRYAWGAADEPNLFNAEGLPASSFRTDDWPPASAWR